MFGDPVVFYDSDILSSFLRIKRTDLLKEVFPEIMVPCEVKKELFNLNTPRVIRKEFLKLENEGFINLRPIKLFTPEADYFFTLINNGRDSVGSGEAAVLALAIVNNGIVASNNFSDICKYIKKYNLRHISTTEIIFECYQRKFITKYEANKIWEEMCRFHLKLPFPSFNKYLEDIYKNV